MFCALQKHYLHILEQSFSGRKNSEARALHNLWKTTVEESAKLGDENAEESAATCCFAVGTQHGIQ